jgi:hypothetical protein
MNVIFSCTGDVTQRNEVSANVVGNSYDILNVIRSVPMFQINLNILERKYSAADIQLPNYIYKTMSNSL